MPGRILIVDDEKDMLVLLRRILAEETEHEVVTESNAQRALELFREQPFDLVVTDLKMPKMDGIQMLEEVRRASPDVSVVILTAYATIETAVEAIQKGAHDYITKPFRRERILLTVNKAMQWQEMLRENKVLREALAEKGGGPPLVGSTPVMKALMEKIKQVAPTMATVLITGPSGTGKELVAGALHQHSLRSGRKLVTVNCTALPEQVIESELFGHVKGAFTGALKDKRGLVEEAHEGTLFLDEIGDLSPNMQTKLLRLLQEGEYKPVGSVVTRKADIRFIAATNHNLKAEIGEKRFREDLYYRLNVVNIELPPLKERKKDIPLLAYHFLKKYAHLNQKDVEEIAPEAMHLLLSMDYPGNVRELENILERGVVFCNSRALGVKELQLDTEGESFYPPVEENLGRLSFKDAKDRMISRFHTQYIMALLRESGGNISRAAEMAGIQRQYLHRLMKDAGIEAEPFKQNGATT
ncbi:MAG: sigma-54 dependent transcriptional regulator [Thermodesulfobacteriota bacterium]